MSRTQTSTSHDDERSLYNRLDEAQREIDALEADITRSISHNDQISASVAALRSMRDQLQEELEALAPLTSEAIESAKYEANEIRKTMMENELMHAEDTLRIVAQRIQELIRQRMDRDADADNYARRVLAMQKLVNRPKGPGTTSSATRELKQLEQENRNMQEQIIALRIATQRNDVNAVAQDRRTSNEKLTAAQNEKSQMEYDEQVLEATVQDRIARAERQLQLEFRDRIRQLSNRYEGTRLASMLSARNAEEAKTMSPKDLLKRALDEARRVTKGSFSSPSQKKAAKSAASNEPPPPRPVQEQVSELATERAKTTSAARLVASQVHCFQTLQDENAALLDLLNKMADEVRVTNQSVRDMAEQLEALQLRLKDEASHREQWIEHDAEHLNASLVETINKKDDELRDLNAQIAEWRLHAEKLHTVSPAVSSVISQTKTLSAHNASRISSSSMLSAASPARSVNASHESSTIRRSMMLDL